MAGCKGIKKTIKAKSSSTGKPLSFISRVNCKGHKPAYTHPSAAQKRQRAAFRAAAKTCFHAHPFAGRGRSTKFIAFVKCMKKEL